MDLNFNHLYYFWTVAREGSVSRAAEELMVSQPTVSAQLKDLEAAMGTRLFERAGRGVKLTDAGRVAFNYASEMFSLAQQMTNALEHRPAGLPLRLAVGVVDVVPKVVVRRMLERAMALPQRVRLVCREDKRDRLLVDLAARRVDVVLSDGPAGTEAPLRGANHLLGESGMLFLATPDLAAKLRRNFPRSLDGTPMLLPSDHTQVRHALDVWLDAHRIHPSVVGEFDDSATMLSFGQAGAGVLPYPAIVEAEVRKELGLRVVGRVPEVRQRFYAISLEETPTHAGVAAICGAGEGFAGEKKTTRKKAGRE